MSAMLMDLECAAMRKMQLAQQVCRSERYSERQWVVGAVFGTDGVAKTMRQ